MVWISCGGARRPYWSQQIRPLAFWTLGECRLPVPAAFMMWVRRNFPESSYGAGQAIDLRGEAPTLPASPLLSTRCRT